MVVLDTLTRLIQAGQVIDFTEWGMVFSPFL
jgi:hypothetical protein